MPSLEESRARLVNHFEGDNVRKESKWDELWSTGEFLPWDRNMPNPALEDTLAERQDLLGPPVVGVEAGVTRRRRALVPGCGAGYDVLLLASFGYDAYGLEVSQSAIRRCLDEQAQHGAKYLVRESTIGTGKAVFLHGDFFANDWSKQTDGVERFDLIYDYTVRGMQRAKFVSSNLPSVLTEGFGSFFLAFLQISDQCGRYGCLSCWQLKAV